MSPARGDRREVAGAALLAAGAAAALAALCASGLDGLSDTDPYRHLAYAGQLWESGFTLRGHPFLPQTLLGTTGVDLWWGFHLLMVPFAFLGVIPGARLAGVCIAATQAGAMAALGRRLGQRRAWLFALLPTLTSAAFLARGFSARPSHLSIPLVALNLAAGAGELAPAWALCASFAHGWLHLSSPLSPLFAGIGVLGALLGRGRPGWRALGASVLGLTLAYASRPDRAHFLQVALTHNLGALGYLPGGRLPGSGMELLPVDLGRFVAETGLLLIALVAMLALGRGAERAGSAPVRVAALIAVALSMVACFQAGRFLDYLLPFLALAASLSAPNVFPAAMGLRVVLAVAVMALAARTRADVLRAWDLGNAFIASPASYDAFAALIRAKVPPGTLLVSDNLLMPGVLYAWLPDYRYLCAYDPVLLAAPAPAQYWRWAHLVAQGRSCAKQDCGPGFQDALEVAGAIRALGSEWFVSFSTQPEYSVLPLMSNHHELFDLVGTAPARQGYLTLWRVKAPTGHP